MRPPDPLPGVEVRPRMLHLAHVQPIRPVVVGRIDIVRRADRPHAGVHRRLEQFPGLRMVPIEAARLLGDYHVPALGLDAGPRLVDFRAVGDLAAHLGLLDDLDGHLRRLRALGHAAVEEGPAGGDLVVDARLPLLLSGEPGMDQDGERRVLTLPKTGRSVPTPANDHKSLMGMDVASGIADNPGERKTGSNESRPLRAFS